MTSPGIRNLWVVCLLVLIPFASCTRGMDSQEGGDVEMESSVKIRQPAVAGQFYPGTEARLRSMVTDLVNKAESTPIKGNLIALISPHAGYIYSGQVAAHAYKLIKGKRFDAVIVIAPSHHVYFSGSSVYSLGPYKTPLGLAEINKSLADAISESDESITYNAQAHMTEHSLEVQLPFLQMMIPELKIVPIVMGDQSLPNCRRLATAIVSNVKNMNVLLVASTDLSHFHSYDEAVRMDQVVIDHISNYDYEGLAEDLSMRKCEACGGGPVITVMIAAQDLGASKATVLNYANSGDVVDDRSSVVGYLAAAVTAGSEVGVDLGLGHKDKIELLAIARGSIESKVLSKPMPSLEVTSPLLEEKMGAFVTITIDGQLRGCIGHIRGIEPLNSTVSKMAVAAAVEDPRFPPLTPREVDRIAIEISVLTPFKKIADADEIEVGRDGLYIEKGLNHGLLLPQVATDYGWERYEFLDHTCMKAGLPKGSWREGATIYTFSAQVFSEEELLRRP
jgi:AmmeMemoRadiSam system protein B/AmmeMemoRadiSam system protein A